MAKKETRVVMMSPTLMKLYDVPKLFPEIEFAPITFYNPQECLDMMVDADTEEEILPITEASDDKAMRLEKQWGELELRLSFFTKAYNWQ